MKHFHHEKAQWLKRRVAAWKAGAGLNWREIAELMSTGDMQITAGSLMSKHSRASFTAIELIALLQVLGIASLELPEDEAGHAH